MSVTRRKQYDIEKQTVIKAYKLVKANVGAVGVDKVSLDAFEKDLKGNLYGIECLLAATSHLPFGLSPFPRRTPDNAF
ncbi:hypothetical protein J2R76_003874 [Bradyrhizobium sp. USDA 4532]|nr:hypothetical protein [Bradyrhizobium sp. USDA 4545]MCP1920283.1 hypothetical protein [Bradyrhizobium sp. USDA 4532]